MVCMRERRAALTWCTVWGWCERAGGRCRLWRTAAPDNCTSSACGRTAGCKQTWRPSCAGSPIWPPAAIAQMQTQWIKHARVGPTFHRLMCTSNRCVIILTIFNIILTSRNIEKNCSNRNTHARHRDGVMGGCAWRYHVFVATLIEHRSNGASISNRFLVKIIY